MICDKTNVRLAPIYKFKCLMTNLEDITKYCMAQKLSFTRFCVTRSCSMELLHVLDRKLDLSLKMFLSLLFSHIRAPQILKLWKHKAWYGLVVWGWKIMPSENTVTPWKQYWKQGLEKADRWMVNLPDEAQCRSNRLVCIPSS